MRRFEQPGGGLHRLLALDRARSRGALRHPTVAFLVGGGLPLVVVFSALWMLGSVGLPDLDGADGGLMVGMLVSGALSFAAYGTLFGGEDILFLKRLGVAASDILLERAFRLAGLGTATVIGASVPYLAAGESLASALYVALSSAAIAVGASVLVYAWAGHVMALDRDSVLAAGVRQWDPGLARAAPLIYAPLLPFLAGAAAGAIAGTAAARGWQVAGVCVAAGSLTVIGGARIFGPVGGRFIPRVSEMAYVPPPQKEGEGFRLGRGLSGLLPGKAAAVWVRDATVAGRRFAWAARLTWPVAVVSILALARWGETAAARAWVPTAVGLALVIQAGAVVGLGRSERARLRWVDRSLGLRWGERWLGRWAWSWGLSLWLLVPVALAWWWWSGAGGAWIWPLTGACTAAVATTASLLNSERL